MTSEIDQRAALPARPPARIDPPAPGTAVLACRCGAVLDLADMRRQKPARPTPAGCLTLRPITCEACS